MKILVLLAGMCWLPVLHGQTAYELPTPNAREETIRQTAFTYSYNEGYELASWAAWQLTPAQAAATGIVKGKFTEDKVIASGTSSPKDYKDAGFIMGQLVAPEDMVLWPKALEECFFMSNVVPQKPAFNKYIWKAVENLVREWAKEGNTIYIVAGPVLADAPFGTFGDNKVSIPVRYYKAVLDVHANRAIGFIFRNNMSSGTPKSFAVSVDELEKTTRMDFFPALPDEVEQAVEASTDFTLWNWRALEQ